ncbi:MAG: hypothetical protein QGH15_06815 [Kiritimatiellia bacterium]|jgi:hypothetical protein|nr:hypothetical protein [Kiritimatiellia bacterium]
MNMNGFTRLFCLLFLALVAVAVVATLITRRPDYDPGPPPPGGEPVQNGDVPGTVAISNQVVTPPPGSGTGGTPDTPTTPQPVVPKGPTTNIEFLRRFAAIKAVSDMQKRKDALKALGRELALEDFGNALRLMKALSDYINKLYICMGIFETKGALDPQEALRQANALDPGPRTGGSSVSHARNSRVYMEAIRSAVKGWASTDPAAASKYLGELPSNLEASTAVGVYGVWAQSDPQGALRSAAGLSDELRAMIMPQIYKNWVVYDAKEAWTYVFNLPDGELASRPRMLTTIAIAWADEDLTEAVEWISQTVTDDAEYTVMLSSMARGLTSASPDSAARMYASIPGLFERNPDALSGTVRNWVRKDPEAAAQWSLDVGLDSVRPTAIKAVASHWAASNLTSAREWAEGLQNEMDKAYALSNVAVQQGQKTPGGSTEWIMQIPDAFTQHRTIAGYVMGRLKGSKNTTQARALQHMVMTDVIDMNVVDDIIRGSKLKDDEKQALLDMLP